MGSWQALSNTVGCANLRRQAARLNTRMHKHSVTYFKTVADWAGGAEKVVAGARNLVHRRVEAGQASNLHNFDSTYQ